MPWWDVQVGGLGRQAEPGKEAWAGHLPGHQQWWPGAARPPAWAQGQRGKASGNQAPEEALWWRTGERTWWVSEEGTRRCAGSSRGQRALSSQALTPPWAAFASWAGPRSPASGMDSGPEETDAHLPRPVFHSGAPINCLEPPPLSPAAALQSGCISHDKTSLKAPVTGPNQSFEI